jgi:hypothetical protein
LAVGGEDVGVCMRDALDEAVEAEPAQVVGHLGGAVGGAELPGNEPAKAFVALLTHPWVPEQTVREHTPPPF